MARPSLLALVTGTAEVDITRPVAIAQTDHASRNRAAELDRAALRLARDHAGSHLLQRTAQSEVNGMGNEATPAASATSRRGQMSIHKRILHSEELASSQHVLPETAATGVEAPSRPESDRYRRVLEARAAQWLNSGCRPSWLLEADELRVVRQWLSRDLVCDRSVSPDIQHLLAGSEAAHATRAARISDAGERRLRSRQRVTVVLVVLTGAALAAWTYRGGDFAAAPASSSSQADRRQIGFVTPAVDTN
jgi:hypothetical protein